MSRKLKAVCGEGRPGKDVELTSNLSLNNQLSNPRFVPVRYSASVREPIRITASAQTQNVMEARRDFFCLHNTDRDTLAKMNVTAVFGTICGWPGMMLRRVRRSNAQPSNTKHETKMPNPLAACGMCRNRAIRETCCSGMLRAMLG